MRDISTKFTGDSLSAAEYNSSQVELENIVNSAGLTLDPATGPDFKQNQLGQAVAAYSCGADVFSTSGTFDAIVLTLTSGLTPPALYIDKMKVTFRAAGANTGAVTVNVNGIGAKKVLDSSGADLQAGVLKTGAYTSLVYDTSLELGAGAFVLIQYPTSTIRFTYEELTAGGGGYGDLLQRTGAGTSTAKAWVGRRMSHIYGDTWLSPGGLSKVDVGDTYNTIFSLAAGVYDFTLFLAAREIEYSAVRIVDYPFSEIFFRRTLTRYTQSDGIRITFNVMVHGTIDLDSDKDLQVQMAASSSREGTESFGISMTSFDRLEPAEDYGPNIYCDLQLIRRNYF